MVEERRCFTEREIAAMVSGAALADVLRERVRQYVEEGHDAGTDDSNNNYEMAAAAAAYAIAEPRPKLGEAIWPWGPPTFKPTDHRRNLVKAGALIIAEIERIDRLYAYTGV